MTTLIIAAVTLHPAPEDAASAASTPLWCFVCGTFGLVDVTLNLLLFMPFGAGLAWLGATRRAALAWSFGFTLAIEALQFTVVPGRDASLSDLLTNTLGGVLGHAAALALPRMLRPSPTEARRGWIGWCAGSLMHAAALCWLLQPALEQVTWYGQQAPVLEHLGVFRGRVLEARIAEGTPYTIGRLSIATMELGRRHPSLTASISGAPPTSRLSPIAAVFDGDGTEQMLLGQAAHDLVFRPRLRTADWGLGWPSLRLSDALLQPDWRGTVDGRLEAGTLRVTARADDGMPTMTRAPLGPIWGWRLLLPMAHAAPTVASLTTFGALWLLALGIPAGWYAAAGDGSFRRKLAIWIIVQSAALAALPAIAGLPVQPLVAWAGAVAALPVGWALQRRTRTLLNRYGG